MSEQKSASGGFNPSLAPSEPTFRDLDAVWTTRLAYCLALLGFVVGQLGQGSWVGLATGGGLLGWAGMLPFLLISVGLVYRVYLVLRYPATLRARRPNLIGWLFRAIGMVAMVAGALGVIGMFLIKPLTLLFLKDAGPNGIGFFVVGLYAAILTNLGPVGCILFELSRLMGKKSTHSIELITPRHRKQNLGLLVGLTALGVGIPFLTQFIRGEPCYGPNLMRCIGQIDGEVIRPAMVPFGDAVRLETNIEELVFVSSGEPRREVKENPAFSLLRSGHPAHPDAESKVRVVLNASPIAKGVAISLQVFDAQGESSKFVTTIVNGARLEPGVGSMKRVVIVWPSRAQSGLQFTQIDPTSGQRFVLDEIFVQMRRSIASPREVAEWVKSIDSLAKEVSVTDIPREGKIDESRPSNSCNGIVKVLNGENNETAMGSSPGRPLRRLIFAAATEPDNYSLSQLNDRIGCNSDGVWAFNYPAWNGAFEVRRYSNEGKLLSNISTRLPGDKMYGAWADMESGKVIGDKITFSIVSIPKQTSWQRKVYEVRF